MSIRFADVPTTLRKPGSYMELNTSQAVQGVSSTDDIVMLIGQRRSGGTVSARVLTRLLGADDAKDYFGQGSQIHRMALAAFGANPYIGKLYALALDDAGGAVAATGSLAIAASSLTAGVLTVWVGGDSFELDIAATDTANDIAGLIEDEIDARPDLPVTASVSTNTVTITARNGGTLGNAIDLDTAYTGTGLTVTKTAMASGATDPTFQNALDDIFAANVTIIVTPYNTATPLGLLVDHLDERSDGVEQRGAVGVAAIDDTVGNATTLCTGLNSGRLTVLNLPGTLTWTPELASAYAAVLAGETDLARPLNGLELKGVHPPDMSDRLLRTEFEALLENGCAVAEVSPMEAVRLVRSVSTRTTNDEGGADYGLADIQTIRVLDELRRALKERVRSKFARVKIADQAHTESTTDPTLIKMELIDVLKSYEAIDYVEGVDDSTDAVVVERNGSDPTRVDCVVPVNVTNGLHILAARIDLTL